MTCTNTRIQIRDLASYTTDPHRAGEIMLEAAKTNVKHTKKVIASNLMKGLHIRKVGTNKVEKVARVLTEENERNEGVVTKILEIEIDLTKGRC